MKKSTLLSAIATTVMAGGAAQAEPRNAKVEAAPKESQELIHAAWLVDGIPNPFNPPIWGPNDPKPYPIPGFPKGTPPILGPSVRK